MRWPKFAVPYWCWYCFSNVISDKQSGNVRSYILFHCTEIYLYTSTMMVSLAHVFLLLHHYHYIYCYTSNYGAHCFLSRPLESNFLVKNCYWISNKWISFYMVLFLWFQFCTSEATFFTKLLREVCETASSVRCRTWTGSM